MLKKIGKIFLAVLFCQLAGAIGSIFTISAIPTWYAALNKPFFSPPNWLFGPAWVTLYTLMGLSLYLVWEKRKQNKQADFALLVFAVQLFLNALWSILFFGLKTPWLGFAGIVVLWLAIALTIFKFHSISKKAAWLLVPYFLWVSFAAILNLAIAILN